MLWSSNLSSQIPSNIVMDVWQSWEMKPSNVQQMTMCFVWTVYKPILLTLSEQFYKIFATSQAIKGSLKYLTNKKKMMVSISIDLLRNTSNSLKGSTSTSMMHLTGDHITSIHINNIFYDGPYYNIVMGCC